MRKILLLVISFIGLIFLLPDSAHAIPGPPQNLRANPFCGGPNNETSRIRFEWTYSTAESNNYYWKFNATGISETRITSSPYTIDVSKSQEGQTISWTLSKCDKDGGFDHGCSDQTAGFTPGPDVVAADCSTTNPQPATPQSCPRCASGFTWSNAADLCVKGNERRDPVSRVDCSAQGTRCVAGEGRCTTPDSERDWCANRDPRCPASTHDCKLVRGSGNVCGNGDGINPICNHYKGDPRNTETQQTYCAYPKGYPPPSSCNANGETCSGNAGSQGSCCDNLICDKNGRDASVGTCKDAPSEFGDSCYKCKENHTWDGEKCVNASGNEVLPESKGYCSSGNNLKCVQGKGCISTNTYAENEPLSLPCAKNGQSYSDAKGCTRIKTALGFVRTDSNGFTKWLLGFVLSIAGGIVIIIIIVAGYKLMTSQGDPEKIKNARDQLTAAIIGLLFIIFSLAILELITRDILGLPGFGS